MVDSFRQFVGTEREKVEAKKQSIAKTERERQLADLKSFQASFKVGQLLVTWLISGSPADAKGHPADTVERRSEAESHGDQSC